MMTLALYWPKQLTYPIEKWPTPARLDDPGQRTALFEAIIEQGSVTAACRHLGMSRTSVYMRSLTDRAFAADFLAIKRLAAEASVDEAKDIADNMPAFGLGYTGKAKVQIDQRLRVAGKLVEHFKDTPSTAINFNDNRTVVVTEEKRKELQERLKRLQESNEISNNQARS